MEFSTNTDLFADAVKRVLPACASKLSIPILGNVQLEVLHNTLIITATDLEVRMAYYLVLEDDSAINGSITVPGKLLQALVAKMGDDKPMRLRTDDERHHVHISVGTADYTLYGLPAEEYPLATMPETIHTLKVPGQVLRSMITRTKFAVSHDETRMVLMGCYLAWADGKLTMAATDTHRLAVDTRVVPGEGEAFSLIVPGHALVDIAKAIDKAQDAVTLTISESTLTVQIEHLAFTTRLLEGMYPEYQRTIRADSPTLITIHPSVLLAAIDRASLVARAESNKIILNYADEKCLTLSAVTNDTGQAFEKLVAVNTGAPVEIGFNAEYLHDVLSVLDVESVTLALDGPLAPAVIQGQGIDGYVCIVMPMQIL